MFMRHIYFIFQYSLAKIGNIPESVFELVADNLDRVRRFISGAWGLSWSWRHLYFDFHGRGSCWDEVMVFLFLHGVPKLKSRKLKNLKGFQLKWKCTVRQLGHANLNLLTILNYFRITASLYQFFSWRCLFRSLTLGGAWCVSHTDILWAKKIAWRAQKAFATSGSVNRFPRCAPTNWKPGRR